MFWGLVMKQNKRYSQKVTKAFHVSQAVLDINTVNDDDSSIQVWANIDDTDYLIATVNKSAAHLPLDLMFTDGESVSFYSKGSGTGHLSGYLLPDDNMLEPDFDMDEEAEDEEMSEQDEIDLKEQFKQLKAKGKKDKKVAKPDSDEEEDDDDSDDSDLDGLNAALEGEEDDDDEDDDDDDDDDEDEEEDSDDDEEDEEDEIQQPPSKQAKLEKSAKQNGLSNGKVSKKEVENEQKQKNQKNQKQEQKQKNQQNQQGKFPPKQLSGGVVVQDLRIGKGPEAKPGRKTSVYYEGKLKSNGKVFDSTNSGEGFKFFLGRGEVIRGWDTGIVGMKVGSTRRITCPPNVAYGPKGSPPVIPGNATLVFDVELRGVN